MVLMKVGRIEKEIAEIRAKLIILEQTLEKVNDNVKALEKQVRKQRLKFEMPLNLGTTD